MLFSGVLSSSVQAAPIQWGAPTNITGDSDVSTLGSLVAAYNFGAPTEGSIPAVGATTINGVLFLPFVVTDNPTTVGNFSVAESPGELLSSTTMFGAASAPFTNLSSSYQALLQSGVYSILTAQISLTMTNLTVGETYQFQWWVNTSGDDTTPGTVSAESGNTVVLTANTTNTIGGLGQYAIGTFVADDSTQVVRYNGFTSAFGPVINGFQLRNITPTTAPEPGTLGLCFVGAFGMLMGVRFRQRNR
jgi:hypothetical protein